MKKYSTVVGIDVSKEKLDVCILHEKNEQFITVTNNASAFKGLTGLLKKQGIAKESVLFCMEHTGVYAYPICFYLSRYGWNYTMISGLAIKKSLGIQRGKSDKADSKSIARFGFLFQDELPKCQLPEDKLLKLKTLFSYRERLVNAKKSIQVPAQEMELFLKKSILGSLVTDSQKLVRALQSRIKKVDQEMESIIKSHEDLQKIYRLSTSVPGIGSQTAIYFMITTRGFSQFSSWKKLACYSGVAPFPYSSGSSIKGKSRVSPFANKKAKTLLSMAAINAIRTDVEIKRYFKRKTEAGKNAMSVLNAIRNKLLARMFAAVKRETPYVAVSNY